MRLIGTLLVSVLSLTTQVFRSGVDAVRVDVLVTSRGKPVQGLTAADFELRDDGIPQEIQTIAFEDVPLSIMLVLDTSASVQGTALADLKAAAGGLVEILKPEDRAAIMPFSGSLRQSSPWTSDKAALRQAIAETAASGGTALYDAVYAGLMLREPSAARSMVLVFSDGADSASWLSGQNVVELAQRTESVVYGVTLEGSPLNRLGYLVDFHSGLQRPRRRLPPNMVTREFLEAVTSETGGKVLNVQRSGQLRQTFLEIVHEFRSRYVLIYTPRNVATSGWHALDVRVKRRGNEVNFRRGYAR